MKKIIPLIIVLLLSFSGFAQTVNQQIESLKQKLKIESQDTTKVLIMLDLCITYRLSNPDSSIYYGHEAAQLADEIQFYNGKVLALGFESMSFGTIGNLPKSLELGMEAIQAAKEEQVEAWTGPALDAICGVYRSLGDYKKALYYNGLQLQITIQQNIEGLAYAELGRGVIFLELDQLDSAHFYCQKALAQFKLMNDPEPLVFIGLGGVAEKREDNSKAMEYYHQALTIALEDGQKSRTAPVYTAIARLYKKINQPDSAFYYAKKGLTTAEEISGKGLIFELASLMTELYREKDPKEALRYFTMAAAAKDSIYGSTNIQAVEAINNQVAEREKDLVTAKKAYENTMRQYAFITGLVTLMIIAFILYRNNRQKQKANIILERTLLDLKSTQSQLIQSEKMASLGELTAGIAHEIQNPLNFVNNFSEVSNEMIDEMKEELAKEDIEEAKALADDIKQNLGKINHHGKRADAIVKGMLQHSRSSTGQKEPTDINALCDEYLRLSYHGLRAKDKSFNADFKSDFDEGMGKVNIIAQDIGRVLLNLINNAFYAVDEKKKQVGDGYEPTVAVSTKKLSPSENLLSLGEGRGEAIQITVKDNGNGIPEQVRDKIFQPFFTTKPTGQGTGLGLSLSYDIVKAHGGELKVETNEGKGTKFIILLQNS